MRHILQGYTMYVDGSDFGIDTEEVSLPHPVLKSETYQGGGMVLEVDQVFSAVEALEVNVTMAGKNPDILKLMARAPGKHSTIVFRQAILTERVGTIVPHIAVVEGAIASSSNDNLKRGEKSGFEFVIKSVGYFRYEVDQDIVHEVQAWPPKLIVDTIDQLADVNAVLGY